MGSPLPPDPYVALGVPKDATQAQVKTAHRKLVLKCHPDKVTDESLKKEKQEEFHKIQEAWETIGEKDARERYELLLKLGTARKEKLARAAAGAAAAGPRPDGKPAHYEVRTQVPAGAAYPPTSHTTTTHRRAVRHNRLGHGCFPRTARSVILCIHQNRAPCRVCSPACPAARPRAQRTAHLPQWIWRRP